MLSEILDKESLWYLALVGSSAAPSLLIPQQFRDVQITVAVLSVELNGVVLSFVSLYNFRRHFDESLK